MNRKDTAWLAAWQRFCDFSHTALEDRVNELEKAFTSLLPQPVQNEIDPTQQQRNSRENERD